MIHDETQDQDQYGEEEGLPADAGALPGKAGEIVPAPPLGDGWVAEAVTAVGASITKLIDEFRVLIAGISERPKIAYVHHALEVKEVSYRHLGSADITKERHLPR